jgi:hypothetical protein
VLKKREIMNYSLGESTQIFFRKGTYLPFLAFYEFEVQEIMPYEKAKETIKASLKAQAEVVKK